MNKLAICLPLYLFIAALSLTLPFTGCKQTEFEKLAIQNSSPEPVSGVNRYYHTDDGNYKIPGTERVKSMKIEPLWQSEDLDWMQWVVTNIQPVRPGNHLSYEPLLSDEEKLFWIDNFDPDLFDWWAGVPMNRGEFSHLRGIAVAGGMEYEYEAALHGVHGFGPDIFKENGLGVNIQGKYVSQPQYQDAKEMTHMSPKWHSTVKSGNVRYSFYGDSAAQDNIVHGAHAGYAQFDDWSNRRFIEYMTSRYSPAHLQSIGFDPESFHIREYAIDTIMEATGGELLLHGELAERVGDALILEPVLHEFIRFYYMELNAALADVNNQVKVHSLKADQKVAAFWGNQAGMNHLRVIGVPLSQQVDVVWNEDSAWVYEAVLDIDKKQAFSSLIYKLGRAAGDFKKPYWSCLHVLKEGLGSKRNVQGLAAAEAHANGGVLWQQLQGWRAGNLKILNNGEAVIGNPEGLDARIHHSQFASANRHLFTDREAIKDAAVVYSVPSTFWRWFSVFQQPKPEMAHYGSVEPISHYGAASRLLEEAHVPYEVIIFGHQDIFDDAPHLERLDQYKLLILPHVDAISDRQADAVAAWVRRGGKLVLWSTVGTKDEEFYNRKENAFKALLADPGQGEVVQVSEELAEAFLAQNQAAQAEIEGQVMIDNLSVETDLPNMVWVNLWKHGGGPMISAALTNYQIDYEKDTVETVKDFTLEIQVEDGYTYTDAYYYRTDYETPNADVIEPLQLDFTQTENIMSVKVPRLDVFGVLTLSTQDELPARKSAAMVRKWYERLKIAKRVPGIDADAFSDLLEDAKSYLSEIQGAVAVADFQDFIGDGHDLSADLQEGLAAIADKGARYRDSPREAILKSDASKKFDFGDDKTEPGFTPVGIDSAYSKENGYGWVGDVNLEVTKYGRIDAVHDDYIRAKNPIHYMERTSENRFYPVILPPVNEAVFKVDLPNGDYTVTAIVGDYEVSYNQNRVGITNIDAQDVPMIYSDRLDAGYFQYRTFETSVENGSLELKFRGRNVGPMYQNNCDWLINALVIRPKGQPLTDSENQYLANAQKRSAAAIRDWYYCGPFDDKDCIAQYNIVGPEISKSLEPKDNWQQAEPLQGDAPALYFSRIFDDIDHKSAVAACVVYSEKRQMAILKGSSTQYGAAFVNGEQVYYDDYAAGLLPQEDTALIELQKGENIIAIKSTNHWGDEWAFKAELYTIDGEPLATAK